MHRLTRTSFASFLLCLVLQASFAGQNSVSPLDSISFLPASVGKVDSVLNSHVTLLEVEKKSEESTEEANSAGKICSCQILNLSSSNYDHRFVVLLAEKKKDGAGNAFLKAKNRIQKEKKHLKQMFYDKIEVVSEMQGTGSCDAMFSSLRKVNVSLQLYEILDADIK